MKKEEKMVKKRKAQAWSMDIIIGVVLFLVILVAVYALVVSSAPDFRLRGDVNKVYGQLDAQSSTLGIYLFDGNRISKEGIIALFGEDYDVLKAKLGIDGELCIVLTDKHGAIHSLSEVADDPGPTTYGDGGTLAIGSTLFCGD